MQKRALFLLLLAAGCGHSKDGAAPASATATDTPSATGDATAATPAAQVNETSKRFNLVVEEWTTAVLRESPETATSLAATEERAGGRYSDRVSDLSRAGMDRVVALARSLLQAFEGINRDQLTPAERVTYDVLKTSASADVANSAFGYGYYGMGIIVPYAVTQLSGAWAQMPDFLDSQHPIRNAQDIEDYLARLKGLGQMLDQETTRLGDDARAGVVPPTFVIDGTVAQLKRVAAKKPAEQTLVQSLKRRAGQVEGADVSALTARAEAIVASDVLPAYKRQIDALGKLRKLSKSNAGVGGLPKGSELYAQALQSWNTTTLTPDEIHQIGLDIVAKNTAEMDSLLASLGKKKGSVAQRIRALGQEKAQLYPNTDAGKTQLIADLNAHVEKVNALLPGYFNTLPKAALQIKRVPTEIEQGSPGGYYQSPALDGSRPGAYYINLRDTKGWPKFDLPTLTHHEGTPGHHFQIALAQETSTLPFARSALLGFSGYMEGWALYAEGVADEIGLYKDDPHGRLGYLKAATFRATRLVVDTGLHAKKWTREQAVKYMVDTVGSDRASIVTEVDRYCVWPGQATAYMLGREVIKKLRGKAQAELGDRFDLKKFHDVVLSNGAVPLSVLERVVDDWIAVTRG
ncbi:MAG: DUF885 family protein [Myxococcota bacterium]